MHCIDSLKTFICPSSCCFTSTVHASRGQGSNASLQVGVKSNVSLYITYGDSS